MPPPLVTDSTLAKRLESLCLKSHKSCLSHSLILLQLILISKPLLKKIAGNKLCFVQTNSKISVPHERFRKQNFLDSKFKKRTTVISFGFGGRIIAQISLEIPCNSFVNSI